MNPVVALEYWPVGHVKQLPLPAVELVPELQFVQEPLALVFENCPAVQLVQTPFVFELEYWPALQLTGQLPVEPIAAVVYPFGHTVQLEVVLAPEI